MKEEYLHHLWMNKILPVNNLLLTDGSPIEIVKFGSYNSDTGPDFFNAIVKYDGLIWSGNIEIHIKSSDWLLHGHQNDDAYNNVVLHVVYTHDKPIFVGERELKTLELRPYVEEAHLQKYKGLVSSRVQIPCAAHTPFNDLSVFQQLSKSLENRMNRKAQDLEILFNNYNKDFKFLLHYLVFQSFGARVNKMPFQELALLLPYQLIIRESWELNRIEALLLGASGLLKEASNDVYTDSLKKEWFFLKQKYALKEMDKSTWKFSGIRPHSFPNLRLVQLASFLYKWKYELIPRNYAEIDELKKMMCNKLSDYWTSHYSFKSKCSKKHSTQLSELSQNLVIVNAFAPFFWFVYLKKNNKDLMQWVFDLLQFLPPDENTLLNKWQKLGVRAATAFDSQALIEQINIFCKNKKCLQCKIGNFILSSKL